MWLWKRDNRIERGVRGEKWNFTRNYRNSGEPYLPHGRHRAVLVILGMLTAFVSVWRLISVVHWLTDMNGGTPLSDRYNSEDTIIIGGRQNYGYMGKTLSTSKKEYHPEDVTPFVYAHHVVCALESEDGTIYTGFCIEACSGVMNLCAERVAALNMYVNSGQTKIKRLIAFRDQAPSGGGSRMPCGACREFLCQLNEENENTEIMVNYETREIVTLKELMPSWWGKERYLNG